MQTPFSLAEKHIIITGASSGIGRQCAIRCSEGGASLLLLGRNTERLNETLNMLSYPENHLAVSVDLTDFDAIEPILKEAVSKNGCFHGLVNAAGISTTLPLKLITPEKLDSFYKTNVVGSINLTRLFTKTTYVCKDGASVIFFSSVMGMVGDMGKTLYSLTKGALLSGTKSMAVELASKKIRVNSISPGVVDTPMTQSAVYNQDEESHNRIVSLHPLGLGKPDDVALACVYLLSDASRWVTGTNLVIDGGYTAR